MNHSSNRTLKGFAQIVGLDMKRIFGYYRKIFEMVEKYSKEISLIIKPRVIFLLVVERI